MDNVDLHVYRFVLIQCLCKFLFQLTIGAHIKVAVHRLEVDRLAGAVEDGGDQVAALIIGQTIIAASDALLVSVAFRLCRVNSPSTLVTRPLASVLNLYPLTW